MLIGDPNLGFMQPQEEPQGTWDISTSPEWWNKSYYIGNAASSNDMNSCILSDDGLHMYVCHQDGNVGQWNLSVAWDVSTATYFGKKDFAANDTATYGIAMSVDGTKFMLLGNTNDRIYEYTLSTPFNITTATYVRNYIANAYGTYLQGMTMDRSGTYMLLTEYNNDYIWRYGMSTPWNLSTMWSGGALYTNAYDNTPGKATFSTKGDFLFLIGRTKNKLVQFSLPTKWDINSAVYQREKLLVTTCGTSVFQAHFKPDGKKMYILGGSNKAVYQFELT